MWITAESTIYTTRRVNIFTLTILTNTDDPLFSMAGAFMWVCVMFTSGS